mmetsp:Transcript_42884/g.84579  ORF Transcript_42884/g.84579 Transcript_42884/m.84579 type:complete len:229 (-) Transcript_42884:588-1274(-)
MRRHRSTEERRKEGRKTEGTPSTHKRPARKQPGPPSLFPSCVCISMERGEELSRRREGNGCRYSTDSNQREDRPTGTWRGSADNLRPRGDPRPLSLLFVSLFSSRVAHSCTLCLSLTLHPPLFPPSLPFHFASTELTTPGPPEAPFAFAGCSGGWLLLTFSLAEQFSPASEGRTRGSNGPSASSFPPFRSNLFWRRPAEASTKPRKGGEGRKGLDLNSGWNCTPRKKS